MSYEEIKKFVLEASYPMTRFDVLMLCISIKGVVTIEDLFSVRQLHLEGYIAS
nr:MAG TPA: hypothetical protein [Inoviridae sp.]